MLNQTPGEDVAIYKLYEAAHSVNVHRIVNGKLLLSVEPRIMQQRLGAFISRINKKLPDGQVVRPGQLKQTYRLSTKAN